jgi:cyclic beta-1,2-glucan synthetase
MNTALLWSVVRPQRQELSGRGSVLPLPVCDRRLLWRFGISGERPILLVSVGVVQGTGLLRSLAKALRLWAWSGLACDLIVLNFEPDSYIMNLQREIATRGRPATHGPRAQCRGVAGLARTTRRNTLFGTVGVKPYQCFRVDV